MTFRKHSIIAFLVILMLITVPAAAAADGVLSMTIQAGKNTPAPEGDGTGAQQPPVEAPGVQNQSQAGILQQTQAQDQSRTCQPGTACNASQLRQMIAEREELLNNGAIRQVRENNSVRLAVHAFTIAAPLLGNGSQAMLGLAEQVNTSAQVTLRAEEQIENRNTIMRALFGGDTGAAAVLQQEITANQERITEMNRLIDECDCDPDTREILREQIALLEQEQQRLQVLAQDEQSNAGLLGWIFR
jgi:hypothetical protein